MARRFACLAVVALLALILAAACSDDGDSVLTSMEGAAHQAYEIELTDEGVMLVANGVRSHLHELPSGTHTDLELFLTNAGSVEHSFDIFADEGWQDAMMRSGPIAPGESYTMQIHFHDAQVAYFRDETIEGATGRIVVGGSAEADADRGHE
jgi:hypothetical protein